MKDKKKPNVLLICTDQWSVDVMGCYGNKNIMTPTLDNLVKNGIKFNNCYSTCPVCIPARRSIMTGTFPKTHGDRVYSDMMLMPDSKVLAQCFKDDGYQAYAVGKMHVYPQRNRVGFDDVILHNGANYSFGGSDDYQQFLADKGHVGEEYLHNMSGNEYISRPWHLKEELHPITWTSREMMRMIKRKDPTKPALFYLSYQSPHTPLVPIQEFLDMYTLDEIEEPTQGDWIDDSTIMKYYTEKDGVIYSEKQKKIARRAYYALCTQLDYSLRNVIGTLREEGLLENTIIGFIADHGDSLFDHKMTAKRNFYEGSAKVPLILSSSLLDEYRGTVIDDIACLEDVMPTLLDLCDIEIPSTVEGISLLNKKQSPREMLFGEISEGVKATRMVRYRNLKLIYYPCGNLFHLFDLQADPKELHNCYGEKEYEDDFLKMETYMISQLHGEEDLSWIENNSLVGYQAPPYFDKRNYGMGNMRGLAFPQPPKIK